MTTFGGSNRVNSHESAGGLRSVGFLQGVRAQFLVSRDKDLLDLMNDASFRQRYPDLSILDPTAFLKVLAASDSVDKH